ncbi:hypothetical protein [Streptomyces coeruleorubidus]|uniref:Uncharacterized protein n=1 Tax=Streptomyces coeruleorubidus TaxID=116188 RepID=A0A5J6HVV6_STRC4|nr:hypothetical protein [Streptomyces coeruleorubidus]QEV23968.1 hypothetical protein CP976_07290 [Streptomyces coeruleorubidus]GGT85742.1 hypothetical protein GCM10010256_52330 [Streptomyces coeruleorubidus]
MTIPVWWPKVLAATRLRRMAAGMLLDHASPSVHGGTLRLAFVRADIAAAWRDSGAQAALEGAMQAADIELAVESVEQPVVSGR